MVESKEWLEERATRLKVEIELREKVGIWQAEVLVRDGELAYLEAELRTLRADKERLDWLDRPWVKVQAFPNFEWLSNRSETHPNYYGKLSSLSLREAIDAAKGNHVEEAE